MTEKHTLYSGPRVVHKENLIEVRNKDYCHNGCISTNRFDIFLFTLKSSI